MIPTRRKITLGTTLGNLVFRPNGPANGGKNSRCATSLIATGESGDMLSSESFRAFTTIWLPSPISSPGLNTLRIQPQSPSAAGIAIFTLASTYLSLHLCINDCHIKLSSDPHLAPSHFPTITDARTLASPTSLLPNGCNAATGFFSWL
ncbi:hypothetical protein PQX77_022080 [Marasmius sp. AFHP31]|nr:hypothetical protein PQX77_022080 [Marasmius sp. AFHP31]